MITIRTQGDRGLVETKVVTKGCWIDARNVTKEDLFRLEREFGIAGELLTDIMDADEQSRIEKEDDYTAIIIRIPVHDEAYEISYFTLPVGIILFSDKIITICQRSGDALEDLATNRIRGLNISNKSTFVLNFLGRAAFTFMRSLKELNKRTNVIERELQKSVKNNELIQLLSVQKSLVYFTTSIKTNELLLEKLQKSSLLRFREEEKELLEDVVTENRQAIEMANIYSSILTGTMDAFASVISNNLNIVMKRLTIVSIVLMIPTLITSFYGMNVGLPFQTSLLAVWGILALSILASIIGAILLTTDRKRKKITTLTLPYSQTYMMIHK
ncbi:magnesium transporter CorA family protein [Breznakiella homolactica]|uniref:Magnesium transporter CorA family protein n=1 Tax=Breznakiella homolactica TaxID=2798577 RepID=A0A7T7XN67_9SPIR|nr:magnesium transporter CorA family protein [Breznakiella homolactica]QQO09434.1 magnesium transporter CorA family protein [Breznakiella homolactica]